LSRFPQELAAALAGARHVGVITGAGISAESGIPTYRGIGGVYDDPARGNDIIDALSGHTLASDPDRTWRAVGELARHAAGARPNAAHAALVEIEEHVERFVLLTQNVDGLHQTAGTRNLIAVHGSIRDARCTGCGLRSQFTAAELGAIEAAPVCDHCGATLRTDAVLFGEMLPAQVVQRMYEEFSVASPEVLLVIGTSALFPYITGPVMEARRRGHITIEVNPERTFLSAEVDHHLAGKAGYYLPLLSAAIRA